MKTAGGIALALWSVAAVAHAQPSADTIVKEGVSLRREGRDVEALAVFERALALDNSPRTRAQVALAEQALGLWVEAERDLLGALSSATDPWFVQHRPELQSALAAIRARLATLDVEGNVAGAEVWINGARDGVLPLSSPIRVVAGTVTIELQAPGYEKQVRTIQVAPQTRAREVMNFAAPQAPGSFPAVGATPNAPTNPLRSATSEPTAASVDSWNGLSIGAWVSAAGAFALLAGAGAALMFQNTNAAMYNDDARCFYGGLTRDQRCGGYRQSADTARTLALVQVQGATAAAGLSVVLFNFASRKRAPVRSATASCLVGWGIACSGSF